MVIEMNYDELISSSNLAFAGNNFGLALERAELAVKNDSSKPEGFICAGKAALSLDKINDAVKYFRSAAELDKKNGNTFFLLGYAQAMAGDTAHALQSLTKAIECGCDVSLRAQIYKMMSMINIDQGDFDNALTNLGQAEALTGADYEVLQQKASCYVQKKDFRKTIFVLNQMKLLQPRDYAAYSLAFNIFMELGIYDEAKAELERAERFAELTMAYYSDLAAYTLMHDPSEDTAESLREKWRATIRVISNGLLKGRPDAGQVFEMYMRAAQLYISLEEPETALKVLDAAVDPAYSYNSGFSIVPVESVSAEAPVYEELSPEDEEALMQEKWENGEFDAIREEISNALLNSTSIDPEELAEEVHQYLTPADAVPAEEAADSKYTVGEGFRMEQAQSDMRNTLYISAYEALGDYDSMLEKARELQSSPIIANQYNGIYFELKAGKYTNKENWEKKYRERISFWTKRMLEDPTDFISASYRIRSYIDIGDYDNAEQLCACLPTDVKGPLMEELGKAKKQGGV